MANKTVSYDDVTGELPDTAKGALTDALGLSPIQVKRESTNITLAATSGTWTDVEPDGSAAARPLDVVIPDVVAGQWVRLDVNGFSGAAANGGTPLDMVSIVAGAKVNHVSGNTTLGVAGWFLGNSAAVWLNGGVSYQIQAGDIENGSARFRLQAKNPSASVTRVISASTAGGALVLEGRGPFG